MAVDKDERDPLLAYSPIQPSTILLTAVTCKVDHLEGVAVVPEEALGAPTRDALVGGVEHYPHLVHPVPFPISAFALSSLDYCSASPDFAAHVGITTPSYKGLCRRGYMVLREVLRYRGTPKDPRTFDLVIFSGYEITERAPLPRGDSAVHRASDLEAPRPTGEPPP